MHTPFNQFSMQCIWLFLLSLQPCHSFRLHSNIFACVFLHYTLKHKILKMHTKKCVPLPFNHFGRKKSISNEMKGLETRRCTDTDTTVKLKELRALIQTTNASAIEHCCYRLNLMCSMLASFFFTLCFALISRHIQHWNRCVYWLRFEAWLVLHLHVFFLSTSISHSVYSLAPLQSKIIAWPLAL